MRKTWEEETRIWERVQGALRRWRAEGFTEEEVEVKRKKKDKKWRKWWRLEKEEIKEEYAKKKAEAAGRWDVLVEERWKRKEEQEKQQRARESDEFKEDMRQWMQDWM